MCSTADDECDGPSDVTRRDDVSDHVIYEDEFIDDVRGDRVDAVVGSTDDDTDYEQFVLSPPVRMKRVILLSFHSFSQG